MKNFFLKTILGMLPGFVLNAQTPITGNGWFFSQAKNYGYTSGALSTNPTVPIANNTKITTTPAHVYYIGNNHKVCDYVFWGGIWQGGAQLESDPASVHPSAPSLSNDGEDLFFVGADNKMYKTIWNGVWHSTLLDAAQVKLCEPSFPTSYAEYNGNKKLMYVCTGSHKICNFYKYNGAWVYGGELNNNVNSEPVRAGTKIIFDGQNHVFYIGNNTGRIHNYWWNGSAWLEGVLNSTCTPVMPGTNIQTDGDQLYYIGTNNTVYRMYWAGVSGWLTAAISPANAAATNFFTYHNDKLYYGVSYNKFYVGAYGIHCLERVGGNWTGTSTNIANGDYIDAASNINVLSNPIYYEGSSTNFFYSHQVSYKSFWDGKIHYSILDFYHGDESQPLTWQQGQLNSNAPVVSSNNTCIGYNSDPNQKMLFYPGTNGYINFFTRKVNNTASQPAMHLTFQQEFNTADPGLTQLNTDWNINWPWGSGLPYESGNSFWHNDIQHNCAINGGNLTISTLQETGQGTEYGSANPVNDTVLWSHSWQCTPITYNYTSQELHTGYQNPSWSGCGPWHADATLSQQSGLFESRLKIPRAKYAWPAFWFIGNVEIDFELGGNGKWLFCNSYASGIYRMVGEPAVGYRYYDDFYTLAIKPTSTGVSWFLNNEEIFHTSETGYYPTNDIILLLQQIQVVRSSVGQTFNNMFAENEISVYPNYLTVDYTRVFQYDDGPHRMMNPGAIPPPSRYVKEGVAESNIKIFPNPIAEDGKLNIDLGNEFGTVEVEIQSALGQPLKKMTIKNTSSIEMDVSGEQPGIYLVKIICDHQEPVIKKVIKN